MLMFCTELKCKTVTVNISIFCVDWPLAHWVKEAILGQHIQLKNKVKWNVSELMQSILFLTVKFYKEK